MIPSRRAFLMGAAALSAAVATPEITRAAAALNAVADPGGLGSCPHKMEVASIRPIVWATVLSSIGKRLIAERLPASAR